MSEEILVNVTPMETRVAVLEDGVIQDIHIERTLSRGLVGNLYAGRIVRIVPGLQAAFVDIGVERTGFLHVSDILAVDSSGRESSGRRSDEISNCVHEGEKVIVQVTKDPLGTKGARLTTKLSLSTRYLVLMPQTSHIGVSQQIEDSVERARLQQALREAVSAENMSDTGGFILRTAAAGAFVEELAADLRFFKTLWASLSCRAKASTKAGLLYENLPLHLRTVRDLARPSVERIVVDSRESCAQLQAFCTEYIPEVSTLLEQYSGERPLFDLYGVEDEIQRALERKVALKSGGSLFIDQTEAMTTIDVNTASYVGKRNQAETILKTNLEAAVALARQLRVRNLGGIIIIDFIDMTDPQHRQQVYLALEKATQRDPVRSHISSVSELGLVEMTRKRSRESLEHMLCESCPVCQGRGVLKTAETVCYDIFREIMRDARAHENDTMMVLAAQAVVDRLLDEESSNLADLEEFAGKTISCRAESGYSQEHFDIILL